MSLGNGIFENNVYKFPILKNQFLIECNNGNYFVFKKDEFGVLSLISVKNNIQHAKECLVKYINKNRKVDFPNLTI